MMSKVSVFATAILGMAILGGLTCAGASADADDGLDLSHAVVVQTRHCAKSSPMSATVLIEEVQKRTGLKWPTTGHLPKSGPAIELAIDKNLKDLLPEGFRLWVDGPGTDRAVVRIHGADARGLLFGVGYFLRKMDWSANSVRLDGKLEIATRPRYAIRGHQLGYRHTANSYDAWNEQQYDQYIRELILFGTNAIESIPFQDESSPVMPVPRERMNIAMSEICQRYGVDYWVWTPALFPLDKEKERAEELDKHEAFYKSCPRLDGVFFPGGDPGDNPPELVLPFLKDLAARLAKHHPHAGMWMSLQGFDAKQVDTFFDIVARDKPAWLTGVVGGPSSPPLAELRRRLPANYRLRDYPDITHSIICQYPVPWIDPAYAFTEGHEPPNPRPRFYADVIRLTAPGTDGFSSYSDGMNDDVNKAVWSQIAWNPEQDVREVLKDYARLFFRPAFAETGADLILALESDWDGPLAHNGSVDAVAGKWAKLKRQNPELLENWRWRLCLLRAEYDLYVRCRLLNETGLETEAYKVLANAKTRGADAAMDAALEVLNRADTAPVRADLRKSIEEHCEALFKLIGYQTSVKLYHARNAERGAILDSVDHPLNNRWWLEDEFKKIRAFATEAEKLERLEVIRTWEDPGPGGCYDDVGNPAKSLHIARNVDLSEDPDMIRAALPNYGTWMDNGRSRWRASWLTSMDWPKAMCYRGLDPAREYIVRLTGRGDALLKIDGQRATATKYSKEIGEFKEFPVPREALQDGQITLSFDMPDEKGINWRQQSMLTEVWLIRK